MTAPSAAPTVGREPELAQLDAALEALDDGAPGALAIEGEPGIGKTRLLRELRDRAEARGHLFLAGSAAEFESSVPFSVWADALDAYVAAQGLEPAAADDLAEILPSLRRPGASGSAVADERYRAHRAMRGLLAVLAAQRPLVLAFDDLHWSDSASIDLLSALLRRGSDAPVLLALAFRPGQAPARLAAALASPAVQRIALRQLTEREAATLLGEADASAIYSRAGGNPFYLEQLARVAPRGGPARPVRRWRAARRWRGAVGSRRWRWRGRRRWRRRRGAGGVAARTAARGGAGRIARSMPTRAASRPRSRRRSPRRSPR